MNARRYFNLTIWLASLVTAAALQCCQPSAPDKIFSKVSPDKTGINFINVNIENEDYNVFVYEYFYNGGGVAVGDINNDGLVDIYLSSNQRENKLYLNKGDFQFEDITEKSGTAARNGWKTGVSMVDINGDRYLDIYVCRSAANQPDQRKNSLYINNGDLTFTEKASEYGLDDNSYSTHASFLDYDLDGDLDMFLLNHAVSRVVRNYDIRTEDKTERVPFVGNTLYENRNGKFVDVSDSAGIYGPAHNFGLGVCYSDLNGDGWPDLYTSNDYTGSDRLLINHNGKKFEEAEQKLLTHTSRFSMGTDIADVNNDGHPDIYSLDMLPDNNKRQKELIWADNYDIYTEMVRNGLHHQFMRNMLHLNNGGGYFSEIGQAAGVSNTDWSWSALFADYDNDGWQDLFVSNGYKRDYTNNDFARYRANQMLAKESGKAFDSYTKMLEKMPSTKVHNYAFKNLNGYQFEDKSSEWGMGELSLTHGASYADLDNDGDLDLVLNNMDEKAGIYRNNSESISKNNFLKLKLNGQGGNRFGLGSKVFVYYNGKRMMREMCPYRGFQSSVEPALHFGLGTVTTLDSVIVTWPGGSRQKLANVQSNQTLTLNYSDATQHGAAEVRKDTYFQPSQHSLSFIHKENNFIDFKYQPLLTRMYSGDGPALAKGDVNGDGLTDYYIGGAANQSGELFMQSRSGAFSSKPVSDFTGDASSEDVDAVFFDSDNDTDLDLYVVSGGYEFAETDVKLQDRLYVNDGKGNFKKAKLPSFLTSGSCARPYDIDQDGDLDLFVGGRIVQGKYPFAPSSTILLNNGGNRFEIATEKIAPSLKDIGMVTDASWADVNGDLVSDLIVVGEWIPVTIFLNEKTQLRDVTSQYITEKTHGFWNCILTHDFDGDGDADIIAGNYGLNSQIRTTAEKPATLYYYDFDGNGSVDPLFFNYIKDDVYPFQTRDELTEQLPAFKKRFPAYSDYANVKVNDILSDDALNMSPRLQLYRLETTYFENTGKSFRIKELPIQFQFAPVFALALLDVNADGHTDIVSGGNLEKVRARTGLLKGNNGFVFINNGKGDFNFLTVEESGINITDDVREIVVDGHRVTYGINNGQTRVFELRQSRPEKSRLVSIK